MQRKKLEDEVGQQQGVSVQYFPYVEGFNDLRDDLIFWSGKWSA
ncbi:hypothetical protein ACFOLK_18835 [Marinococcus halophilus]